MTNSQQYSLPPIPSFPSSTVPYRSGSLASILNSELTYNPAIPNPIPSSSWSNSIPSFPSSSLSSSYPSPIHYPVAPEILQNPPPVKQPQKPANLMIKRLRNNYTREEPIDFQEKTADPEVIDILSTSSLLHPVSYTSTSTSPAFLHSPPPHESSETVTRISNNRQEWEIAFNELILGDVIGNTIIVVFIFLLFDLFTCF